MSESFSYLYNNNHTAIRHAFPYIIGNYITYLIKIKTRTNHEPRNPVILSETKDLSQGKLINISLFTSFRMTTGSVSEVSGFTENGRLDKKTNEEYIFLCVSVST